MNTKTVALVGATGAVGVELIKCLEARRFPLAKLALFASPRSSGKRLACAGGMLEVQALTPETDLSGYDFVFFTANATVSREHAQRAAEQGACVIDNSSAFRRVAGVPLVVPEVNGDLLSARPKLIANPNCSTIIAALPLKAIDSVNSIQRVIVSTYQAASGAGAAGMAELRQSTLAELAGERHEPKVFAHPYAFNLFSHNTRIDPHTGYNEEELKIVHEMRKILDRPELAISATCVRVPVMRAHCESITVECRRKVDLEALWQALRTFPGVRVVHDPDANHFPMPVEASGQDSILVGRLRLDLSDPTQRSVSLFVAGDQLLKGAALNAVQIAERVLAH
jgi:aspartate-semialdehyde dehydrogenase